MLPAQKNVPFNIGSAQATPWIDCGDYPWVSVHILTQGGSSTVTFQSSNDGVNAVSTALGLSSSTAASPATSTTSASVVYSGPLTARFFRLNITGIASGITSGVIALLPSPRALSSPGGTATVSGEAADGAAAVGNPVQVAGVDSAGNVQRLAVNTDGELLVNLETADIQIGAVEIKNATTDDRTAVQNLAVSGAEYGLVTRPIAPVAGSGVVTAQTQRVVLATDVALPAGTNAIGTVTAVGSAAHDAAISGNPGRIGFRALTANYTAVATGDTADAVSTLVGAQIQKPYSIPEADWSYAAATSGIVNTTTAVTIKDAGAAGIRSYITSIQIMAEALGTATELAIRDGAGGTVLWRTKIGTGGLTTGQSITFHSPLKSTAATLLEVVTLTASVTGAVYFNAQGYSAP